MKTREYVVDFSIIFVVTFVSSVVLQYVWLLLYSDVNSIAWRNAFHFGVILAVVLELKTVVEERNIREWILTKGKEKVSEWFKS